MYFLYDYRGMEFADSLKLVLYAV